jgi:hypothetical protein
MMKGQINYDVEVIFEHYIGCPSKQEETVLFYVKTILDEIDIATLEH